MDCGKGSAAAVTSLHAIGMQDDYLTSNDGESFYKPNTTQHTNFSRYNSYHLKKRPNGSVGTSWPFGETIKWELNPTQMGDLLSNMYLKCRLPELSNTSSPGDITYMDQVGRAIINQIKFKVDETTLETINNDWFIIQDELMATTEEKWGLNFVVNGGAPFGLLPGSSAFAGPMDLYIPLGLFFSHRQTNAIEEYTPYFPVCAITNQKIYIDIEFNPQTFFANTAGALTMDQITLVTEEITLTERERNHFMFKKQSFLLNTVIPGQALRIESGTTGARYNINVAHPVKAMYWFFRNVDFEDKNDSQLILERYNLTSNVATSNVFLEGQYPVMASARVWLNKQEQIDFTSEENTYDSSSTLYYKYVQPRAHNLYSPTRNIYTYSFSLDPKVPKPTGAVDMAKMNSNTTFIDVSLNRNALSNTYNMYTFYTGYKVFTTENGFGSLTFG